MCDPWRAFLGLPGGYPRRTAEFHIELLGHCSGRGVCAGSGVLSPLSPVDEGPPSLASPPAPAPRPPPKIHSGPAQKEGYDIIGTAESEALAPTFAKMVLRPQALPGDTDDRLAQLRPMIREASVVVYALPGREEEAHSALLAAAEHQPGDAERVFVAVTDPITWGRTLPVAPAEEPAETSAEPSLAPAETEGPGEPGEGEAGPGGGGALARSKSGKRPPADGALATAGAGEAPGGPSRKGSLRGQLSRGNTAARGANDLEAIAEEASSAPSAAPPVTELDASMEEARAPMVHARALVTMERTVARGHRPDVLRTHVVCPGMVYGHGEHDMGLHLLFKAAFQAPREPLPVYGPGSNVLPLVHLDDLCAYVLGVVHGAPPERYLIACEPERATLREVTEAVARGMGLPAGEGGAREADWLECLARPEAAHLLMHAPMVATPLPEGHGPAWGARAAGFVDRIGATVAEYRTARGLLPLRAAFLGPPGSGKTLMAEVVAKMYRVERVTCKAVVAWAAGLEDPAHPARARVEAALKGKPGRLPDDAMAETVRDYLLQPHVASHGWVLDGYPKAAAQVAPLLASAEWAAWKAAQAAPAGKGKAGKGAEPKAPGEGPSEVPFSFDARLAPTHVVSIDCDDATSAARVRNAEAHEAETNARRKEAGEPPLEATHNNPKDLERRRKAWAELRAADRKDLDARVKEWSDRREALLRVIHPEEAGPGDKAKAGGKKADKGAPAVPADPAEAERQLEALGPAPEHGGLLRELLAHAPALLLRLDTSTAAPGEAAAPADPKAKPSKDEEERAARALLCADVDATAGRLLHLQAFLGVPRTYEGLPGEWDPLNPLQIASACDLSLPVGGRPDPRAAEGGAPAAELSAQELARRAVGRRPGDNPWVAAERIVRLERRAELEAQPLREAVLDGHGHRLTQYLLDDVMPSITTALLGIKDPEARLPDDPLSYLARTLVSGADERVQENIDPYASPIYKLKRATNRLSLRPGFLRPPPVETPRQFD